MIASADPLRVLIISQDRRFCVLFEDRLASGTDVTEATTVTEAVYYMLAELYKDPMALMPELIIVTLDAEQSSAATDLTPEIDRVKWQTFRLLHILHGLGIGSTVLSVPHPHNDPERSLDGMYLHRPLLPFNSYWGANPLRRHYTYTRGGMELLESFLEEHARTQNEA